MIIVTFITHELIHRFSITQIFSTFHAQLRGLDLVSACMYNVDHRVSQKGSYYGQTLFMTKIKI